MGFCRFRKMDLLCQCAIAKTRAIVLEHQNVCPNCRKKLIEDTLYEEPIMPDLEESAQESKSDMGEMLKLFKMFGSVKERATEQIKLKLPYFEDKYKKNVKVYFLKLRNYFEAYRIIKPQSQVRILMQVLDGNALDLYLTLTDEVKADLNALEEIFSEHFRPARLDHVELKQFWQTEKLPSETVSEFAVRLQKRAEEIVVPQETLEAVFLNALPEEFQKHVALQKASGLKETVAAAIEFEKTTRFAVGQSKTVLSVVDRPNKEVQGLANLLSEFMKEFRTEREKISQIQAQAPHRSDQVDVGTKTLEYGQQESKYGPSNSTQEASRTNNRYHRPQNNQQSRGFTGDWRRRDEPATGSHQSGYTEKRRLRCFNCQSESHLVRNCPQNQYNGGNSYNRKPQESGRNTNNYSAVVPVQANSGLEDVLGKVQVRQTDILLDGNTSASDMGMANWVMARGQATVVNLTDGEFRLHKTTGTNRGASLFAEYHGGVTSGNWKDLNTEDENFAVSKFNGGQIFHLVKPSADKYMQEQGSFGGVTEFMEKILLDALNRAKRENRSNIWVPLASKFHVENWCGGHTVNFVLAINLGIVNAIKRFQEEEKGRKITVIINGLDTERLGLLPLTKRVNTKPVERLGNVQWKNEHFRQKKEARHSGPEVLFFGDSIIKHLDKSEETSKPAWVERKVLNCGISGDKIENVFWRLTRFEIPKSVRMIILAAGTNNLFNTDPRDIVQVVRECDSYVKEKYPGIKVLVQSLLPRGGRRQGHPSEYSNSEQNVE